ncbi:MerR family transcriptional regulator [uncultured Acetatifactor sp.]|jgi:DNA-binding transcriptional MerR regulator|uniref:MerR family transcriptional regulator n=1 Tax=uncultured Acetatifactor sp. TaxID=1671927 RepID=UPI00260FCE3E|nr:MerR family transcriptional regulator [uncultured Acetatifactor sp.]
MEQERFTVGELAALAGVSPRTIRYYDKKGLLCPVAYSENQYRQYDKSSLLQLQQVLMLKYIGFSLEEIIQIFQSRKEMSIPELLAEQKRMLLEKRQQLDQVISVVEKTQAYCRNDELTLPQFSELVKMLTYNASSNKTFEYYEKYGSKQQDWYPWLFRQLQIQTGENVLDIGGGYGLVWRRSFSQIPQGVHILVLDKSQEQIKLLRSFVNENRNLLKKGTSFSFQNADLNQASYGVEAYDCIVSLHMWPYVENRTAYLDKTRRALKPRGRLCANFNWRDYAAALDSLLKGFSRDLDIQPPSDKQQESLQAMEKDFRTYFPATDSRLFENELHISDSDDLYRFLLDRGAVGKQIAGYGREFVKYLDEYLEKKKEIVIPSYSKLMIGKKES